MSASDVRRRSATDTALLEMLRECTGTHFLDSGDAYGRHWQRNRRRDIEAEAESIVSFKYGEIGVSHRVYHWLRERLEIDEEASQAFDGPFCADVDPEDDKSWGELREAFPAWFARWKSLEDSRESCPTCVDVDESIGCDDCGGDGTIADDAAYSATGMYGDGEPITINTYNEENLLDQTLLFTYFELRSGSGRAGRIDSYVVLQIHGGCDVRGGYTRPRVFRVVDDELAIFDYRRGTIFCDADPDHWWTTDDGYHWYQEGACGRGAGTQLEAYERVQIIGCDEDERDSTSHAWVQGALCWTEGGAGFCPLCSGNLGASSR